MMRVLDVEIKDWRLAVLYAVLAFVVLFTGCATPADRAVEQTERTGKVAAALGDRHYKIVVTMMNPLRGGSRQVSPEFFLEVKGDTLVSYLPYFGRAYQVPYGGGKGLNFTEVIKDYETQVMKKGRTQVTMKVKNEEDTYLFRVDVYDNGEAHIALQPQQRERISYSGEIDFTD